MVIVLNRWDDFSDTSPWCVPSVPLSGTLVYLSTSPGRIVGSPVPLPPPEKTTEIGVRCRSVEDVYYIETSLLSYTGTNMVGPKYTMYLIGKRFINLFVLFPIYLKIQNI